MITVCRGNDTVNDIYDAFERKYDEESQTIRAACDSWMSQSIETCRALKEKERSITRETIPVTYQDTRAGFDHALLIRYSGSFELSGQRFTIFAQKVQLPEQRKTITSVPTIGLQSSTPLITLRGGLCESPASTAKRIGLYLLAAGTETILHDNSIEIALDMIQSKLYYKIPDEGLRLRDLPLDALYPITPPHRSRYMYDGPVTGQP